MRGEGRAPTPNPLPSAFTGGCLPQGDELNFYCQPPEQFLLKTQLDNQRCVVYRLIVVIPIL